MTGRQGERRKQILQTLANMLENPHAEKITTAALAAHIDVSEAALYRHFASKAQMFEELIKFIEDALFSRVNKIQSGDKDGFVQAERLVAMLLEFAEKNPGMTRVLTGEALVHEHERLQQRINRLFDQIEAALCQSLDTAQQAGRISHTHDTRAFAAVLTAYVAGRWQFFVKTHFKRPPQEGWGAQRVFLIPDS